MLSDTTPPIMRSAPSAAAKGAVLGITLLIIEFIGGMQTFVARVVLPFLGQDLGAHEFYGLIVGVGSAASFFTMPLGPWLIKRFTVAKVMLFLTLFNISGGVLSAFAAGGGTFVLGRVIAGLSSGALAAVSLSAIFTDLPPFWRRLVLAGYNVMWLIISFAGPVYATWVTTALSWRAAYLIYLPFLAFGRGLLAWQLRGSTQSSNNEALNIQWAALLAFGVVTLSLVGFGSIPVPFQLLMGSFGSGLIVLAARKLLIAGTTTAKSGRPAAVATMGILTAVYFGVTAIAAIVVRDVLDGSIGQVSVVLGASTVTWALAGLVASKWPAASKQRYIRRSHLGTGLLAGGIIVFTSAILVTALYAIPLAFTGWGLAGIGMGLIYLDTINLIAEVPPEADGVSKAKAASSTVMVEAIAPAITGTLAAALLGQAVSSDGGRATAVIILVIFSLGTLALTATTRRAAIAKTNIA